MKNRVKKKKMQYRCRYRLSKGEEKVKREEEGEAVV
jgi:hypothetical protein